MQPKVSVCIPIYNVSRYLASCLNSVMSQTMKEIEIICVEDASSDGSRKILQSCTAGDSRFKIILHEKNLGTHASRKEAVFSAQGKYIMFLDSDDELVPHACETAFKAMERNGTDAVNFGVQEMDFQGNPRESRKENRTETIDRMEDNWIHLYDQRVIKSWAIWNKIYRAELCKQAFDQMEDGYFLLAEDVYFFFVFGYLAGSFSMIDVPLYKYRAGVGIFGRIRQAINLEQYAVLLSEKRVSDAIFRFYERKPDGEDYKPIIQRHAADAFFQQSVLWWHEYLRDEEKAKGLQLFREVWGEEKLSSALTCLSGKMKVRIQNLNKEKAKLQREKQKVQNENKCLKKELDRIKDSTGYKMLKKYYHMRDTVKNSFPGRVSKKKKSPDTVIPPAK